VKQNLPQVTSYTQYFSWPVVEKIGSPASVTGHSNGTAVATLGTLELRSAPATAGIRAVSCPRAASGSFSLPVRVAMLRIIAAVAGSLLLLSGAERLFLQLEIRDPYGTVALFCLLSCQMMWATLAHIGNDWLAVPIAVWALVALNVLARVQAVVLLPLQRSPSQQGY